MVNYQKCKRCGRTLKDPGSQARGYGPICFLLVIGDENRQLDLFDFEVTE